jgi:hypothetical protein
MDALTVDLIGLRYKVQAARIVKRIERESGMAIEIKGLKMDALTARANLDRIKAAYARFNDMAPAHAIDVEGLAEQVSTMQSDLEFAAGLLGNSPPPGQELPVGKPMAQAGVGDLNQPMAAPDLSLAPQQLNPLDLVRPNDPNNPMSTILSHAPMARSVPSRRDL